MIDSEFVPITWLISLARRDSCMTFELGVIACGLLEKQSCRGLKNIYGIVHLLDT